MANIQSFLFKFNIILRIKVKYFDEGGAIEVLNADDFTSEIKCINHPFGKNCLLERNGYGRVSYTKEQVIELLRRQYNAKDVLIS